MGRKEVRKAKKNIQKKVGKTAVKELVAKTNEAYINSEIDRRIEVMSEIVADALHKALREFHISEERTEKIQIRMTELINERK